ncbi:transporter substrate-binding domain-containing protein [Simiduia sp. 21SJ11W-1]|uniref:substrate-binding periplasmic protein n=1 Tax=Simiduia sp. 21SJ11W-1 TaxID=2909669 RepID=UPI00209D0615|nr:transporter substrate-binding domain-containing protein [Simiduia sp. 21SJ11W-1]UTA48781.1 transporter substrate-binding domain-containing protein [Simiduia sp. 21SJ11W-1]
MTNRPIKFTLLGLVTGVLLVLPGIWYAQAATKAKPVLKVCADHYPPFTIYDTPAGPPRGSIVEILETLAVHLEYDLTYTANTPFRRCLSKLEQGEVDLMGGLLFSAERAKYLHLFPYLTSSKKSFYVRHDSLLEIRGLEDLTGLTVGTTLGHKYFPAFDNSQGQFVKANAGHVKNSFQRLLAGRVDVVIATERQAMFLIADTPEFKGKFKTMPFSYSGENRVYIGLSKRSPAAERSAEFADVIEQLLADNTFEAISRAFYQRYFNEESSFATP